MDVDEIVAGLNDDERQELLRRLQEPRSEETNEDLRDRVTRLEELLERRGPMRRPRGPRGEYGRGEYGWACGGPPHAHHHCPHCGW
ncbi:MAG TPA: hypothetical protein VMU76_08930 [Acidimicrobiales bacterium]|nr:hypothetical protein [Acidimicrobiales bacterium]